jgi:hypothetical protein
MNDEETGGTPLPISEVRIVEPRKPVCRSLGVGRKRGGQPGNTNRLRHGGFSAKARERREWVRALVAETDALILRVEMVGRARRGLAAKLSRVAKHFPRRTIAPRRTEARRYDGAPTRANARFAAVPVRLLYGVFRV